jgi:hypothetical protein
MGQTVIFDYSLTGVNSALAVEKGLAEAEWYTCLVSKAAMRSLLERHDDMGSQGAKSPDHRKGKERIAGVVAKGSCHGTVGTFLNFRDDDPNWADIFERGSQVRSHPVEWLEHIPG